MSHPLISVAIATWNRTGYLYHTINCIRKYTTYPNIEIIVSDDGSEDVSVLKRVCKKLDVDQLILNEHGGMGANFNAAVRACKGDYILHLEDDWELMPTCGDYIQECLAAFDKHETLGMIRLQHWRDCNIDQIFTTDRLPILTLKPAGMIYVYSSSPHIKRISFHEKVGYFEEGRTAGDTETIMAEVFNKQNKVKIGFLKKCFLHTGHFSVAKCASGDIWDENHTPNKIPIHYDNKEFRKMGLL